MTTVRQKLVEEVNLHSAINPDLIRRVVGKVPVKYCNSHGDSQCENKMRCGEPQIRGTGGGSYVVCAVDSNRSFHGGGLTRQNKEM